jgi:hypothetical protein
VVPAQAVTHVPVTHVPVTHVPVTHVPVTHVSVTHVPVTHVPSRRGEFGYERPGEVGDGVGAVAFGGR